MTETPRAFVILARMRTGSNLLEQTLATLPGVTVHGELYNPSFIGRPNRSQSFGMTLEERNRHPLRLLRRMMRRAEGLPGFRYFDDHDPRVRPALLADPGIVKIALTRDLVETYVSLKIARATGQWQLRNAADRRHVRVTFDPEEFAAYAAKGGNFAAWTGAAAATIDYAELRDLAALNRVAAHLGRNFEAVPTPSLLRQNPETLRNLVLNPADLDRAVAAQAACVVRASVSTA